MSKKIWQDDNAAFSALCSRSLSKADYKKWQQRLRVIYGSGPSSDYFRSKDNEVWHSAHYELWSRKYDTLNNVDFFLRRMDTKFPRCGSRSVNEIKRDLRSKSYLDFQNSYPHWGKN